MHTIANPKSQIRNRFAWFLPIAYSVHLLEEYYAGATLPVWLNTHLGADLSATDFLWINGVAMSIILLNALQHMRGRGSPVLLVAITVLFAINGLLHCLASLYWWDYVPGTISGCLIYIPMGIAAYRELRPRLIRRTWRMGVVAAVVAHLVVFLISQNI